MNENLKLLAMELQAYVLGLFTELHAHPETRWETPWTRAFIIEEVRKLGFVPLVVEAGIIVDIRVPSAKRTLLFRADFDGLPNGHTCGHDTHVAMLLGFLKAVKDGNITLICNIRMVFEDAEEGPGMAPRPESGSQVMIRDGVLDGVDEVYALHIWNRSDGPLGTFCVADLANSGRFRLKLKAKGGHSASPHLGVNALRGVCAVMSQLFSFGARRFDPLDPIALEPVICNSGTGTNILPAEAEMWWSLRTLLPRAKHVEVTQAVIEEARTAAASVNVEISETEALYGHPALLNPPRSFDTVSQALDSVGQTIKRIKSILGGESFAHYLEQRPGLMVMLCAHSGPECGGDHHSPTFNPDLSVLWLGVLYWLALATAP
jgi:amidohydrolase